MDELIFYRPERRKAKTTSNVIRVSDEAYDAIAEIAYETGKPTRDIASRLITYAYEHAVIKDKEADE